MIENPNAQPWYRNDRAHVLRKRFAESKAKNAVHGSDSDANAEIEGNFF
jgi:nucleoside diphosphate kinase